jgi:hypothetical protein
VLGDACPPALAPTSADDQQSASQADLVLIAPSPEQRRDRAWVARAGEATARRLSPTGIAYVLPAGGGRLCRSLEASGLAAGDALLHVPDPQHTRHVAPIGTPAERYLLSGGIPMKKLKRMAALAAGAAGRRLVGPSGNVYRHRPHDPLARWLFELDGTPPEGGSCLLTLTGQDSRGAVLYRFRNGASAPDAVAKISPHAREEIRGLREIAPQAARAGVRVPALLFAAELAAVPAAVQSVVAGRCADRLIAEGSLAAEDLQPRVGDWLENWSRSTARICELGERELERFVFAPLAQIPALATGYAAYHDHLRALAADATGRRCPLVAAHGDLTAANIVIDGDASLGVVDWEAAADNCLPLTDFLYAAVDAVAARAAYADRTGAFVSCFAPDGDAAQSVERLRSQLAGALALDDVLQELCFHACWLHHAANESVRSPGSRDGPFVTILRAVATDPGRAHRARR